MVILKKKSIVHYVTRPDYSIHFANITVCGFQFYYSLDDSNKY